MRVQHWKRLRVTSSSTARITSQHPRLTVFLLVSQMDAPCMPDEGEITETSRWLFGRSTGKEEELNKGIAEQYDELCGNWEGRWGNHMHLGFYESGAKHSLVDYHLEQVRMIEESLAFAGFQDDKLKKPNKIIDVGCGMGGSALYLARKFGAECNGIALSPVEVQSAQVFAAAEGLADQVSFQVADALNQPFSDGDFNLIWSLESGEHMPDKAKFVGELARIAAPGATIVIVTWCHRDLLPSEDSLRPDKIILLNKICDAYHIPKFVSAVEYVKIAESYSLEKIRTADWSANVAPIWPELSLILEGHKKGLLKYTIISCRIPE